VRRVWAICRKELVTYFASPVAWIVAAIFLVLFGFFFSIITSATREAHMRYVFHNMNVTLLLIAPMLTMRLFAEELKLGTFELLMTSPITLFEVVLGKFLGAALLFLAIVAVTVEYPVFLFAYGNPDWGPLFTSYIGFVLIGFAYLSVGMFASSLTDNQIVATIIAFGILLMLGVIGWAGQQMGGPLGDFIQGISVFDRFENFTRGVLDTGDALFYLSLTCLFMFLTVRSLDWRRW
jgi:ABC-2 type transport system permease protein